MKGLRLLLVPAAVLLLAACVTPAARRDLVILVSIDGFRWDYLQRHDAPTLRRLAAGGVHATRLTPCFPSKTFPNHYSIVTGLYPEHHGIVANWFYDPADDARFDMGKVEPRWWDAGEPVWVTAEKQGVRTACYFWPGAEARIRGVRPALFQPFDKKQTVAERVDGLLAWLARSPDRRPGFATLYFDLVDTAGHDFGPLAPETGAAVKAADDGIARLLAGLERLGLADATNLVIVSDHGMTETSPDRVVFFEDLVDLSLVRVEATGPYGGLRPKPGVDPAALVPAIRAKAPPPVHVYRREEVPARLHYDTGERIPPIVILMDDHWSIERRSNNTGWAARFHKGNHGWDPATPNMGALFIASGPAFRHGVELPDVANVNIYNLLCALLGLRAAPNDGDQSLVRAALAP